MTKLIASILALATIASSVSGVAAQDPFQSLDMSSPAFTAAEMTRAEVEAVLAAASPAAPGPTPPAWAQAARIASTS